MSFVYAEKNRITINDDTIYTLAIYSDTKISFDNNASNWSEPTRRALKQYGLIKTLILNQTCCLSFAGNNIYYVYQLLNTLEDKKDFSEEYLCNQAFSIHKTAPVNDIEFIVCYVKNNEQHIVCIKNGQMNECENAWIGSSETFRTMQGFRMEKLTDPAYNNGGVTSELFRKALQMTNDETVGKDISIKTLLTSESNCFFYADKFESYTERSRIIPAGGDVPLIDDAAEGGFTAVYYESVDEVRIDFTQTDLTILYTNRYRLDQDDVDNPNTRYFLLPVPIKTSTQQVLKI